MVDSTTISMNSNEPMPSPSLTKRIKDRLPTLEAVRKTTKVCISLLIGFIMNMDGTTKQAIGSGTLFVVITCLFYFPNRSLGVVLESIMYGTAGSLLSAAWCTLGMFLANLARNPLESEPIQAASSAVLAVFLFFGTFVVNYIRVYFPKANFACIFACIILTMTMTSASSIPGFQPAVMYAILIPIAVGTAITLVVTVLIWPEDTMTNYLICLSNSLNEYNSFFKDHSDAFVSLSKTSLHVGLRQLHSKMLDSVLILIDSKRAVQREILYSYLSSKDCSKITKIVKQMRAPLHGIGFSLLKKKEGLGLDDAENEQDAFTYIVTDQERQAFNDALTDLIPLYTEMASLCHVILMTTSDRFSKFGNSPRSATTTFLWPFIRFNIFKRWRQNKSTNDNDLEKDTTNTTLEYKNNLDRLGKLVAEMEAIATPGMITFLETIHLQEDKDPRYGLLYVLFCYQMNLKAHSTNIIELAETLIQLEHDRPSKRFWLPSITLKKWFQSSVLDPQDGGDNPTSSDQGLIRTRTRPDALDDDNLAASSRLDTKNYKEKKSRKKAKFLHLDPDLYPPSNKIERFFFSLHLFKKWCFSINTFFAFKTAVAVVLLSIPAYRREDVGWYNEWQGRWAQITLVLWLFPMAGMFYLSSLLRFVGTVIGGVLGIVVWEISRGNPYGLSVLCFVCFMFFQYAFLFGPPYMRPLHMVAIVTLVLVTIYEMQYIQDQVSNHDEVYTVAGKRMLLVIIGILGATILNMIPSQVNGRVELRRRLAITITQVGRMYSLLTSSYMVPHENPPTENQRKTFRKWMVEVQRQIADERALLMTSKFEPSLRGKFPLKEYTTLVDRVENMADLVDAMVYAARSIDDDWRDHISTILMKERQDYLSSIMVGLKLTAGSLSSKMSYPPFLLTPDKARNRFSIAVEKKMRIQRRDLNVDTLPNFAAFGVYLLASSTFVSELQVILNTVIEMVGVDDPFEWKETNK